MSKIITLEHNNQPVHFTADGWFNATESAERFGKAPSEWLRLPSTVEYLQALERKYGKIPYLKTKRGQCGGTWLCPKLAVRFAQWLNMDFVIWCDEQIDALMRGASVKENRQRLRHEAASSYKVMSTVLALKRQAEGKTTGDRHYKNEAFLVNWALTGRFESLDRDSLPVAELDVIAKLEEYNTVLVGSGKPYAERKPLLQAFAADWRNRHLQAANDTLGLIA